MTPGFILLSPSSLGKLPTTEQTALVGTYPGNGDKAPHRDTQADTAGIPEGRFFVYYGTNVVRLHRPVVAKDFSFAMTCAILIVKGSDLRCGLLTMS